MAPFNPRVLAANARPWALGAKDESGPDHDLGRSGPALNACPIQGLMLAGGTKVSGGDEPFGSPSRAAGNGPARTVAAGSAHQGRAGVDWAIAIRDETKSVRPLPLPSECEKAADVCSGE